jgi:thioredoxin reductase (NADPH)
MEWDYECAIVGGGPGGLVSALYLSRFKRKVVLINNGKPRAAWIPKTQNLIGYDRGISGRLLLRRLHRQVSRLGLEVIRGMAKVKRLRNGFEVETGESSLKTKTVILATGLTDFQPQLKNLVELRERGFLRYCSICDGYEYLNQPLSVLAKDDFGIQKALFIGHWTKDLTIIVPESLGLSSYRRKELNRLKVKIRPCRTLRIVPSSKQKGIDIYLDEEEPFFARASYVELGCRVNSEAFDGLKKIRRSQEGFLTTTIEQRTSIPNLFAVGDCVNVLGQISVAAGQAAVAATTIHNDLL